MSEVRSQKTEIRSQKSEDRRQKTEDRSQKTEDRRQKSEVRFFCLLFSFSAILISAGCQYQMQRPMRVCPGKASAAEALSILRLRSENIVSVKANGQCRLQYYVEGKKKPEKENFPVKLWFSPHHQIRLQGDVAFDPKGIVLGSNEDEFWLAIKLKEVSSYWWGQQDNFAKISPEILLEALGIAEISGEGNWSLSNEGVFDVLTKRDLRGIIKKIYVYSCDYRVRRIEYFDMNGQAAIVTEMDKYKQVIEGFFVPSIVKIVKCGGSVDDLVSVTVSLKSIKSVNFSEKAQRRLFTRPQPKGFKHIYKIIDGNMIERAQ